MSCALFLHPFRPFRPHGALAPLAPSTFSTRLHFPHAQQRSLPGQVRRCPFYFSSPTLPHILCSSASTNRIVARASLISMATPLRGSNSDPLLNSGPPASFLQHLLDEINGVATRTILHSKSIPHGTRQPQCNSIKQPSSVWVGGSSVAQDARDKLRAADEAHFCKAHVESVGGLPGGQTSTSCLHASPLNAQPPSSDDSWGEEDVRESGVSVPGPALGFMMTNAIRPTVGGLRLVTSSFDTHLSTSGNDIARSNSPLIFSDVDLEDFYFSSPPTEAPTSPGTEAQTSMTSAAIERHTTPSDYGSISRMSSSCPCFRPY